MLGGANDAIVEVQQAIAYQVLRHDTVKTSSVKFTLKAALFIHILDKKEEPVFLVLLKFALVIAGNIQPCN